MFLKFYLASQQRNATQEGKGSGKQDFCGFLWADISEKALSSFA